MYHRREGGRWQICNATSQHKNPTTSRGELKSCCSEERTLPVFDKEHTLLFAKLKDKAQMGSLGEWAPHVLKRFHKIKPESNSGNAPDPLMGGMAMAVAHTAGFRTLRHISETGRGGRRSQVAENGLDSTVNAGSLVG